MATSTQIMETRYTRITALILLIVLVSASCSLEKRRYTSGYYVARHSNHQKQQRQKSKPEKKPHTSFVEIPEQRSADETPDLSLSAGADLKSFNGRITAEADVIIVDDTCDLIKLINNVEIRCKITEVSPTEIKYRKCKDPNGSILTVAVTDVRLVQYSDGTVHQYDHNTAPRQISDYDKKEKDKKAEGFGIAGTFIGIAGLLVAGILLGITAIVFGAISMNKIEKNQEKYKQKKGWAIASLIIGFVAAVGASIVLMNMQ